MSDATSHRAATPWLDDGDVQLHHGDVIDVLRSLPAGIAQTCVTSPPYWGLRDYGEPYQIGLEPTPEFYVKTLVCVFREVRRVLRDDGTVWLNLGDSYVATQGGRQHAIGELPKGGRAGKPSFGVPSDRSDVDVGGWSGRNIQGKTVPSASSGLKPKDLVGIPWRVAFALQADGWYLRSDIVWSKPNPMPESVTDRPTKAHEYLFLLAKSQRYLYDAAAIREPAKDWSTGGPGVGIKTTEHYGAGNGGNDGLAKLAARYRSGNKAAKPNPAATLGQGDTRHGIPWESDGTGRNRRSVWEITTQPFPEAHFATFPEALVQPCVLAGSRPGDVVLDPFIGSGTTALVARKHGRRCVGIDLNESYLEIAARRTNQLSLLAAEEAS